MKINMPEKVSFIIDTLYDAGFEAYAVGGCIRDSILGVKPKDWDITTSANPYQVKELFKKTFDTGIEHGTVTVLLDHEAFEVTTYRIDGKYKDGRHPEAVAFTPNLSEDLLRRDFTINAMAYNDRQGLVDLFGGLKDLSDGVISAVGEPIRRFDEDALRIMRAVRFASVLGFTIDPETLWAMKEISPKLQLISAERIKVELFKLLHGAYPELIHVAYESLVTKMILPEWDECELTEQNNHHHMYDCGEHIVQSIIAMNCILGISKPEQIGIWKDLSKDEQDRLLEIIDRLRRAELTDKMKENLSVAMFFHDIGKPACKTTKNGESHFYGHAHVSADMARDILKRLKCDNETIEDITALVHHHDDRYHDDWEMGSSAARRVARRIGKHLLYPFLMVQFADSIAHDIAGVVNDFHLINNMITLVEEIYRYDQATCLKELNINGKDLMELGLEPGPRIGDILDEILSQVIDNPSLNNDRQALLDLAKELIKLKR